MKIQRPDILWHGKIDRILSLDFHPFHSEFVTAGTDSDSLNLKDKESEQLSYDGFIKIWTLEFSFKEPLKVNFQYCLKDHLMPVNCVKFNPTGDKLASASDDGCVIIYQMRQSYKKWGSKETSTMWAKRGQLRGHSKQVLDLKWSSSGKFLISGSMDGRAYIWNVQKQIYVAMLPAHQRYVQGVSMDGGMQFAVTVGQNREVKIWKSAQSSKKNDYSYYCYKCIRRANFKNKIDEEEKSQLGDSFKMFFDDSVPTFFRRPDFSPDSNLVALPAGQWQLSKDKEMINCCLIFRKKKFEQPCLILPTDSPVIGCRFNPKLFKTKNPENNLFKLNYTMLIAVATVKSAIVFSTESTAPLYGMGNYHLASITDLAWHGQQALGVSSSDGYCSFMTFEEGELGETVEQQVPVEKQKQKQKERQVRVQQQVVIAKSGRQIKVTSTPFQS